MHTVFKHCICVYATLQSCSSIVQVIVSTEHVFDCFTLTSVEKGYVFKSAVKRVTFYENTVKRISILIFRAHCLGYVSQSLVQASILSWPVSGRPLPGLHIVWALSWENLLCHIRTIKTQTNLRISAVWSASLLFAPWIVDATMSIGPSLCSVTDEHHFLSN